jgi:hypothetical protein
MNKPSLILVLLLAGCSGSSDMSAPAATPAPQAQSAPMADAFYSQVSTVVAAAPDEAEAPGIAAIVATAPEDTEPVAF